MINWKRYDKLLTYARNKYVLAVILFLVWITFFDRNNFISRYRYSQDLDKLNEKRDYYIREIERNKTDLHALKSDPENLERFAREKYLMKRDDEEIFIIVEEESPSE